MFLDTTLPEYYNFLFQFSISELIVFYFFIVIVVNLIEQILEADLEKLGKINNRILLSAVIVFIFGVILKKTTSIFGFEYQIGKPIIFEHLVYVSTAAIISLFVFYLLWKIFIQNVVIKSRINKAAKSLAVKTNRTPRDKIISKHAAEKFNLTERGQYLILLTKFMQCVILVYSIYLIDTFTTFLVVFLSILYLYAPVRGVLKKLNSIQGHEDGSLVG